PDIRIIGLAARPRGEERRAAAVANHARLEALFGLGHRMELGRAPPRAVVAEAHDAGRGARAGPGSRHPEKEVVAVGDRVGEPLAHDFPAWEQVARRHALARNDPKAAAVENELAHLEVAVRLVRRELADVVVERARGADAPSESLVEREPGPGAGDRRPVPAAGAERDEASARRILDHHGPGAGRARARVRLLVVAAQHERRPAETID